MASHAFVFALFSVLLVSFIIISGCTKEEEEEFNAALMEGVKQEAANTVKNATGGLIGGGTDKPKPTRECRFDSDCKPVCEGNTFWKRGCDAQTDKCVKTFDTDCSSQYTSIGEFSFEKLCYASGCADAAASISDKKSELIAEANGYTAQMEQANELQQVASKNCRSALADVTDKLIIDAALSLGKIPKSTTSIYSMTTKQTVERIGKAAMPSNKMSAEEYIALNCKAVESLGTDFALASKKRDIVMKQAEAFAGR